MANNNSFSNINSVNNAISSCRIPLNCTCKCITIPNHVNAPINFVDHNALMFTKNIDVSEKLDRRSIFDFLTTKLKTTKTKDYASTKNDLLSIKNKVIKRQLENIIRRSDLDNKKTTKSNLIDILNTKRVKITHFTNIMGFSIADTIVDHKENSVLISLLEDGRLLLRFIDVIKNTNSELSLNPSALPESNHIDLYAISNDKMIYVLIVCYETHYSYYYRFLKINVEENILEESTIPGVFGESSPSNGSCYSSVSMFADKFNPLSHKKTCYALITNWFGYSRIFDFDEFKMMNLNDNSYEQVNANIKENPVCRNAVVYIKGVPHVFFFYRNVHVYKIKFVNIKIKNSFKRETRPLYEYVKTINVEQYYNAPPFNKMLSIIGLCLVGSNLVMFSSGSNRIIVLDYFTLELKMLLPEDKYWSVANPYINENNTFVMKATSHSQVYICERRLYGEVIDIENSKLYELNFHCPDMVFFSNRFNGIVLLDIDYSNAFPFQITNHNHDFDEIIEDDWVNDNGNHNDDNDDDW